MPFGVGNFPIQSFIGCVVVNISQPFTSMEPKLVWSSPSVQNSVNMHLDPVDALRFNRVLVLVVWLRKLITNHELPVQLHHGSILLGFGVVTPQDTWNAFRSQEVTIDIMKTSLLLHAMDVEHV